MNSRWPPPQECIDLLRTLGADERVVQHTQAVARAAAPIARAILGNKHEVDLDLVEAGALLHDVGRARTHTLEHASVGAELLRQRGFPEPLWRIVERHTGGGIDPQDAQDLGLPIKDYTPRTIEERIVCQADNLVDGVRRQKLQEELDDLRDRGLDRVAAKIERLHRELSTMAGRDLDDLA